MSQPSDTPSFSELALSAPILQALKDVGYEAPSPIQAASIPPLLEGRDILGQAQTGTGKTAAFALPILSRVDVTQKHPQVLVLAPTRELAIQVCEAFQAYARHMKGFHILPVYGGQSMSTQLRQLSRGVHIVVGTPGRVMDHIRRGTLDLSKLQALVLDEADEMLKMGFVDDVEWIMEQSPDSRQVALFSATMPREVRKIAQRHLKDPVEIKIQSKTSTVSTITQKYWQVTGTHKLDALTRILEVEDFDAMIIFVRTKTATVELAEKLEARGYATGALNGDMNQASREQTIARLKNGKIDIAIATDVAARGLDVSRITHVVNYDIPYDAEAYVHRIGRTGRAGRTGTAILFVAPREKRMLRTIERATRQEITSMKLPTREDVADRRVAQFKQQITDAIESQELAFFEEVVEQYQQEHNVSATEIAAALAYIVQKDRPLVPKANEMPAPMEPRRDRDRKEKKPRRDSRDAGSQRATEAGMMRYRIAVGRDHGAQPKNIVGAIANEAGLDSQHIGHIKLHDSYSTVDLPEGMPSEVLQHLKNVRVCNQKLNISTATDNGSSGGGDYKRRPKGTLSRNKSAGAKPVKKRTQ